jgi:hypothetical protein
MSRAPCLKRKHGDDKNEKQSDDEQPPPKRVRFNLSNCEYSEQELALKGLNHRVTARMSFTDVLCLFGLSLETLVDVSYNTDTGCYVVDTIVNPKHDDDVL